MEMLWSVNVCVCVCMMTAAQQKWIGIFFLLPGTNTYGKSFTLYGILETEWYKLQKYSLAKKTKMLAGFKCLMIFLFRLLIYIFAPYKLCVVFAINLYNKSNMHELLFR